MKPNLILLHGALGSKMYFSDLKARLQDEFNVFDLDFEGHGDREMIEDEFSIELFSDNLMEFIEEQNLEKTHLFGYSMGGFVALDTASVIPEKIDRIVTLGTKFEWNPRIAEQEIRQLNPDIIEVKLPRYAARLAELHTANDWKVNMELTVDLMVELGERNGFDNDLLEEITNKVTIGIGEEDKMVSADESEFVARLLPNGKLHVLPNQPHPIEKVNLDILVDFIISNLK